ncbi:ParM/StbA family protein [Leptolyngbya sp. FACHB-16]|uniref:ParM/StbA family protein n=1 Tax=unclassified Leptolyngbya TaxID=2650499 RepID=UPI0016869B0C|nr:ParM/StbA family protein [Leptolyngbya sp. FACHB-16]MBD2153103.1 ParM/StbA family protein [Leptolyngbya sp. FACHB-16]
MNVYSVDPGNHAIKFAGTGDTAKLIDSVSAQLPPAQQINLNPSSVLIEVLNGHPSLVDRRWVIGSSAYDLISSSATFTKEKSLLVPQLTLAGIEPPTTTRPEIDLELSRLYISHPQPDLVTEHITSVFQEDHRFYRTQGKTRTLINLSVEEVCVVPEGLGSLRYALAHQTVQWGSGLLAVIDLGGGTAIGSLWREGEQEVIHARAVLEKGGIVGLVTMIAADSRMRSRNRGSYPKPHLLMAGIRNETYEYGSTGANYRDLFEEYRPGWWNSLLERFQLAWGHWLEEIDHIIVTGGGAMLVTDAIERSDGWMRLCPNGQFANVLGLLSPGASTTTNKKVKSMRVA